MLSISALGQPIAIDCPDPELGLILAAEFDGMTASEAAIGCNAVALHYRVDGSAAAGGYVIVRDDGATIRATEAGEAAIALETDVILELQRRRADLLFFHAAAVERNGRAYLLAAESGAGKSTTTWGLLHHGFRYLTDELSALDLASLRVHPFPYALSFKSAPHDTYPLPEGALDLGRVVHLPTRCLPAPPIVDPVPLAAVFLLNFAPDRKHPQLIRMASPEASAHLYTTVLNALAHPSSGLSAVVHIAERVPCYALASADLRATCDLVSAAVAEGEAANRARGYSTASE